LILLVFVVMSYCFV